MVKKLLCMLLALLLLAGCAYPRSRPVDAGNEPMLPGISMDERPAHPGRKSPEPTHPTEAPTEPPTEAPTEAPTEPTTEPPTEAPTEPPTEAPTEAPTEPATVPTTEAPGPSYSDVSFTQHYTLYFGQSKLDTELVCVGNRPYVNASIVEPALSLMNLPPVSENSLRWPMYTRPDGLYLSLIDEALRCGLFPVFFEAEKSVHLYRLSGRTWEASPAKSNAVPAYLRLEDLTADNGLSGRFTHENLSKLRLLAEYLHGHGTAVYLAWIPLYVNPGARVTNDISRDWSYYNTDFVFTLDWMLALGGQLGLHGLTHQSGNEISADGTEFGSAHSYTDAQLLERFAAAEAIAGALGYTPKFFEFPHEAVTAQQAEVAERHFSAIYQQCPFSRVPGNIERRDSGSHSCLWVPTPADYVYHADDFNGILERLTMCYETGKLMSFFFHPILDAPAQSIVIEGEDLRLQYDEQAGILPRLLKQLDAWGYRLAAFS